MRFIALLLLFPIHLFGQRELQDIRYFPPNMYLDTAYAPFYYGVASGDPLQDRVILWTHITPPDSMTRQLTVSWVIALDTLFMHPINKGKVNVTSATDWTIKVDADGLQPGNIYYYRFTAPGGRRSCIGRAKTLPADSVKHVRIAVMSCSSIFSGYFNAYRRLGERDDINVVIHLGDYIYDFVDDREKIRVPDPYPTIPYGLEPSREREKYYLADPDFRYARQQQTWIVVWDNHDIKRPTAALQEASKQAFFEYVPIRVTDPEDSFRVYRTFRFGKLADLFMLDEDSYDHQYNDDPAKNTFLGEPQDEWLMKEEAASTAKWRLVGSQRLMGMWLEKGLPVRKLHVPGDGKYFDTNCWDGYPLEREKIFQFWKDKNIRNNVVLSGDAHISFATNLTPDPWNRKIYNRHTGEGAVGVEFLPGSISRGNFDKFHLPRFVTKIAERLSKRLNPQHVYCDFVHHGYGILDVTPEWCVAEFWYSPINLITGKEKFAIGLQVFDGVDHWDWKMLATPVH